MKMARLQRHLTTAIRASAPLIVPTLYDIGHRKRKNLPPFSRAFFSVKQEHSGAPFYCGIQFLTRAIVAFAAANFAPTVMAVRSLLVPKKQVKRLLLLTFKARFHVSISTV
jgi:hypothetical protein